LKNAAIAANKTLFKALAKCTTEAERRKVKSDRDAVVLSYLRSLEKSLEKTGPAFEKMAKDLETETENVKKKAEDLKTTVEAINLFTDLVRLAASLALAFGAFA
jgi:predicted RNase H-like nuclease (RuvC/YqgF family)